jgi:hypothetical protein
MPRGPTPPFCRCLSQRRAVSSACALLEFILSPAVSGSPLGKGCKRPGLRAAPGRGRSTSPSTAPARKLIDCTRDARARANTHTRTPPTTHEHTTPQHCSWGGGGGAWAAPGQLAARAQRAGVQQRQTGGPRTPAPLYCAVLCVSRRRVSAQRVACPPSPPPLQRRPPRSQPASGYSDPVHSPYGPAALAAPRSFDLEP